MDVTPPSRTSEAMALSSVLRGLAMAVGSQLIALALTTSAIRDAAGTVYPDERAYVAVFMMVSAIALVALGCAMLIPRLTKQQENTASAFGEHSGTGDDA
jgi:hypothetical protein